MIHKNNINLKKIFDILISFVIALLFLIVFTGIAGSDPRTFINNNFIKGTIFEPYKELVHIVISAIVLAFLFMINIICNKNLKKNYSSL